MKLKKLVSIGLVTALFTTTFTSCKKGGCTDPDSITYDAKAKKNDGTCQFQGEVVFWYGQTTADSLIVDGASNLTFSLDGQVVGSTASSVYWVAAPNCGDNASITVTKDLGNVKTQSYPYTIKDQTGFVYWSGNVNINANTCIATEITW